jgi:hypothetical protein
MGPLVNGRLVLSALIVVTVVAREGCASAGGQEDVRSRTRKLDADRSQATQAQDIDRVTSFWSDDAIVLPPPRRESNAFLSFGSGEDAGTISARVGALITFPAIATVPAATRRLHKQGLGCSAEKSQVPPTLVAETERSQ